MLVALPASIAFGVSVYTVIGSEFTGHGALAGVVGATVMGIVASWLGGTDRLVSAPCAPAAAVLSAFAIQMVRSGDDPHAIVLFLILVGALGGLLQILFGIVGIGRLIRYIPYPVVSGYMTGVGLIIIGSQIPKILGAPAGLNWRDALTSPAWWDWRALLVGAITVITAAMAPRITRRVPGTILGILGGIVCYCALAAWNRELRVFEGNALIVGSLSTPGDGMLGQVAGHWRDIGRLDFGRLAGLFGNAVILATLLSIDTLKTCVVLDKMTRSSHDSDRELRAQGVANMVTAACGGVSGAGTMGATLVALNSGAVTRAAGLMAGTFALLAALIVGSWVGWIPVATLAGILVMIGVRMIDREALNFVRSRATVLDFCVVLTVVAVALGVGLIMASAVGVGLSMILFVREQSGGSAVRHKIELGQTSSTWHRPERETALLAERAADGVIFELQGALFFGNTYRLHSDLEQELRARRFVIIDLRRVQSVDVTAIRLFIQIRDTVQERGAQLILSGVLGRGGGGRNLAHLIEQLGAGESDDATVKALPNLDVAIAWVENRILAGCGGTPDQETPIMLREMDLFAGYRDDTLLDLQAHMQIRRFAAGDTIYTRGSVGDELYWVRCGAVRLMAPSVVGESKQVAGFGRGDFFGGLSFLDNKPRPNNAMAMTRVELYVLTRADFNEMAIVHKKLAFNLASAMARTLAMRLRRTEKQLAALRE